MAVPNTNVENEATTEPNYDQESELKAFDDAKAGVKGLVDAGITRVPRIFIHPPQTLHDVPKMNKIEFVFPVIDLVVIHNLDPAKHIQILEKVLNASEIWGFFQLLNHGIPMRILHEMLDGVRRFHEQDTETKKMLYKSNFNLYSSPAARWRDSFNCIMAPDPPTPDELPSVCRDFDGILRASNGAGDFSNKVAVRDIDCAQTLALFGHYYPACSQPELTLGATRHSDYNFLTLVLQDNLGGLQVLHQDQWVDVPPLPGALVVNIRDHMQQVSNDRLRSVEHRVLVSRSAPRVSVASFFGRAVLVSRSGPRVSMASFFGRDTSEELYGQSKELISDQGIN